MRPDDEEFLANALRKQSQGRGLKNSELSAIRAMDKIQVAPLVRAPAPSRIGGGDPSSNMLVGRDSVAKPEDLAARVKVLEEAVANLDFRLATLETLLSGFARRSISVCDAGTTKTMTIASTAPV